MAKSRHGLYSRTTGKIGGTEVLGPSTMPNSQVRVRSRSGANDSSTPAQVSQRMRFRAASQIVRSLTSDALWKAFLHSSTSPKSVSSAISWMCSLFVPGLITQPSLLASPPATRLGPVPDPLYFVFHYSPNPWFVYSYSCDTLHGESSPDDRFFAILLREDDPTDDVRFLDDETRSSTCYWWRGFRDLRPSTYYHFFAWFLHQRSDGKLISSNIQHARGITGSGSETTTLVRPSYLGNVRLH